MILMSSGLETRQFTRSRCVNKSLSVTLIKKVFQVEALFWQWVFLSRKTFNKIKLIFNFNAFIVENHLCRFFTHFFEVGAHYGDSQ